MTALDKYLASVKERAEAATPGPWEPCIGSGNCEMTALSHQEQEGPGTEFVCDLLPDWALDLSPRKAENMEFIAHARTDVDRLAAMVEAARKHLTESCLCKPAGLPTDCAMRVHSWARSDLHPLRRPRRTRPHRRGGWDVSGRGEKTWAKANAENPFFAMLDDMEMKIAGLTAQLGNLRHRLTAESGIYKATLRRNQELEVLVDELRAKIKEAAP
jgi:hypothetical protein